MDKDIQEFMIEVSLIFIAGVGVGLILSALIGDC